MHDPRGKASVGLGYAISDTGADHVTAYQDPMIANPNSVSFQSALPLGITEALPLRDLGAKKVLYYSWLENWNSMGRVLGLCYFGPAPRSFIQVDEVVSAVRASTGWELTVPDLMRIGERATNLAHVFNVRQGFSRKDDVLPERLFAPLGGGVLAGVALSHAEFEQAMTELYTVKGWDPATGCPTRERLRALDIEWAADLTEFPGD
jgi:aldehyde:ferredoxin oxidoreductase